MLSCPDGLVVLFVILFRFGVGFWVFGLAVWVVVGGGCGMVERLHRVQSVSRGHYSLGLCSLAVLGGLVSWCISLVLWNSSSQVCYGCAVCFLEWECGCIVDPDLG